MGLGCRVTPRKSKGWGTGCEMQGTKKKSVQERGKGEGNLIG